MSQPLTIALPPGLELEGGETIRITALNAATGATVSGVNISNVSFQVAVTSTPGGVGLPKILLLRVER